MLQTSGKIRLLDVGSCFNPFLKFEEFLTVGIDIVPAVEVCIVLFVLFWDLNILYIQRKALSLHSWNSKYISYVQVDKRLFLFKNKCIVYENLSISLTNIYLTNTIFVVLFLVYHLSLESRNCSRLQSSQIGVMFQLLIFYFHFLNASLSEMYCDVQLIWNSKEQGLGDCQICT